MAYQRLAYDDVSSAPEMAADCRAVEAALRLPTRGTAGERMSRATRQPAPSIMFEHYPHDMEKPQITVGEAAARLGAALHLHLD